MSRKRLTTWIMIVAVAPTARIAVASPRAAMAELRALSCCMRQCPESGRPPMRPHRCCAVSSDASDPASPSAVTSLERPDAAPLAVLPPAAPVAERPTLAIRPSAVASRAGPTGFLDTQKLRC